jgi:hypothetical protein
MGAGVTAPTGQSTAAGSPIIKVLEPKASRGPQRHERQVAEFRARTRGHYLAFHPAV